MVIPSHSILVAQNLLPDSVIRQTAINSVIKLYDQKISENSHLYNGTEFIDPFERQLLNGHAYFLTDDWQEGFIYYDGQLYENVLLKYDLFRNKVIVEHPESHQEIELISEQIKYFGLSDQFFVRLQLPAVGFYARIYDGDIKVYALHYKTTQDNLTTKTKTTEFLTKRKLYIFKDETYHPVNSKGSALTVLKEQKSELKKMINQENISFEKNKEFALRKMGERFDQLKRSK
ncbi:MAG: hypothetical protein ABL895_19545 [Cyclobacteriaceae bacterium]